jgi:imidazolonepropionase-like amidohydrolase
VEVDVVRRLVSRRALGLTVALALIQAGDERVAGQAGSQARAPGIVALRGGTVLTITRGIIPNGTVVLRDGRIAAVGANADVPAGAEVIDVSGRFVTPGLIDAHSHIANDSINEGGTAVSSMTGMEDVLDPTDINIYRDLAGGLTTANVLHGSANPIGGKSAVIKLRWGKTRGRDLLFEGAMPGIKFALGENPKQLPRQLRAQPNAPLRYPTTRSGVEFVIRDAFTRAKAYQTAWKDFDKAKVSGQDVVPPRRDLQLEPLVEVLDGKRLVHAHTYRADETLMLMRLAEEMGFRIATFQHVLEGYRVAKEMAAHGAGGSTFSDWWGYKVEAADATPYNAAIMLRKGVLVSVNSDSAEHARRLNTEAAKSIKWGGLTDEEALSLVTINPAKQLRIDSRVGSLEVGKDADVAVWTHHPLSSYAIVDRVYIDGLLYYDRLIEERRLTDLKKEKSDLAAAEKTTRRTPATEPQPQQPSRAAPFEARNDGDGNQGRTGVKPGSDHGLTPERAAGPSARNGDSAVQAPATPAGSVLAITNARIHPVTAATVEKGTILIRGNKIDAVGANVQVPSGARVLDAAGADVYPGFIDASTSLGLDEPGPRGFDDVGELIERNPHLRTRVAFHVESDAIPVARANGITSVAVVQAGGIFGGEIPVMNLDGWTWEEATLRPNAAVQFTFPALGGAGGGRGGGRGGRGAPPPADRPYDDVRRERDKELDQINRVFDQARAYARAGSDRTTDWALEALVPVVERRLPLVTAASREADIREAIAFADRAKINIVIAGGAEANRVAPLLKEKNIPVILGDRLTLPGREDDFHAASYQLAGELVRAGVKVAFSSGDSTNVRLLPYSAAMSVAWGMTRDDAVRALTINAAEILGVADRIGSIEVGKDANLFVAKGDPLEIRTQVTHVIIQGQEVGIANKHLALYEKYIKRP